MTARQKKYPSNLLFHLTLNQPKKEGWRGNRSWVAVYLQQVTSDLFSPV